MQRVRIRDLVLRHYGYDDLSDRLDLLAVLYHDSGNMDKALSTLEDSKRLCGEHNIKFDGEDILEEYSEEKKKSAKDSGWPALWERANISHKAKGTGNKKATA